MQVLGSWKADHPGKFTKGTLVKALRAIDHGRLADKVESTVGKLYYYYYIVHYRIVRLLSAYAYHPRLQGNMSFITA